MNWLVKWYWFEGSLGENNAIVKSKILKLCDTYEEAYKTMIDLILGPDCYGWYRVEKN